MDICLRKSARGDGQFGGRVEGIPDRPRVHAAALEGVLRILSFMGLGIALIGIGWAYGRVIGLPVRGTEPAEAPNGR